MAEYSFQGLGFPPEIAEGKILPVDDALEDEHWIFVVNHPAFSQDLELLKEEKEQALGERDWSDLKVTALENPAVNWPFLRELSAKWGLPPAALLSFAQIPPERIAKLRPEAIAEFRQTAHGLVVDETPDEVIVRIPRPVTMAKKRKLSEWLKTLSSDGPREIAWNRSGKIREDLSEGQVEALPWFYRWNTNGEEPAEIWRELTKHGGEFSPEKLSAQAVYDRILAIWERMRRLSEDGIRKDPPSKRRA